MKWKLMNGKCNSFNTVSDSIWAGDLVCMLSLLPLLFPVKIHNLLSIEANLPPAQTQCASLCKLNSVIKMPSQSFLLVYFSVVLNLASWAKDMQNIQEVSHIQTRARHHGASLYISVIIVVALLTMLVGEPSSTDSLYFICKALFQKYNFFE